MVDLDQAGRGRSILRKMPPPSRLSPWVEQVSLHPRPCTTQGGRTWRIVADVSPHIIVTSRRGAGGGVQANVVGARSRHADTAMADRDWTVCVRMRPGALYDLTGLPAAELTDRSVPLRAFTGIDAPLLDELEDAHSPADAARVVLCLLDARLRRSDASPARAAPLLLALRSAPAQRLREVAAELGLAPRTLHHVAVTAVGLSPRRITRILRLHGALAAAIGGAGNWARIAATSGYADQPHLVREFRALLGEAPGTFMRRGVVT